MPWSVIRFYPSLTLRERLRHSHCAKTEYHADDADVLSSFKRCSKQGQHHHHSQVHSSAAKASQSTPGNECIHARRRTAYCRTDLENSYAKHIDPFWIKLTIYSSPGNINDLLKELGSRISAKAYQNRLVLAFPRRNDTDSQGNLSIKPNSAMMFG